MWHYVFRHTSHMIPIFKNNVHLLLGGPIRPIPTYPKHEMFILLTFSSPPLASCNFYA